MYGPLDLRNAGHVQRQGRHAFIVVLQCAVARSRIYPLRTPSQRLFDERPTDATVRAGDQNCLILNVHTVLLSIIVLSSFSWLLRTACRSRYVPQERFPFLGSQRCSLSE